MRSTLRHAGRTRCVALFKTVHAERKEQKELLAKATRTWQGYRRLREGAHWLHQRQEEAAAERHSQCGRVSWRHVRVLVGAFRSNALPWIATLCALWVRQCMFIRLLMALMMLLLMLLRALSNANRVASRRANAK